MGRLASQIMINASAALLQADLALAELVIARGDAMDAQHDDVEQRCITLHALHAPAATNLRPVVATLQVAGDLQRMGALARHTARIARFTHAGPGRLVRGPSGDRPDEPDREWNCPANRHGDRTAGSAVRRPAGPGRRRD
ncbi:MAG: PhoU domain-containing protein [Pseudonocardiaceae bacterium]